MRLEHQIAFYWHSSAYNYSDYYFGYYFWPLSLVLFAASFTLQLLHSNGISTPPPSYNHSITLLPSAPAAIVQSSNYYLIAGIDGNNSNTTYRNSCINGNSPTLGQLKPSYLLFLTAGIGSNNSGTDGFGSNGATQYS